MLDCCVKKCTNQKKISRGDTYVCCWLCDNMAHVICAGFSHIGGRVVDLISSKIGLNWTCHDCRSVENDMRAFMRQTQKEFNNIFIEFRDLNERFKTMEAHFKKLKVISESPKRKKCMPNNNSNLSSSQGQSCPPTNVPSTAVTDTNRLTKDVMNNAAQESPQESPQGCVETSSETISGKLNDARTNSGTFAAVCSTSPMLISLDSPIHPTPPPVSLAPTITVTDTGVVATDTSVPEKNSTGSITNAITAAPSQLSGALSATPLQVTAVPPRRAVFVSRLHASLTENDIAHYVCSKLGVAPTSNINVYKFNFKYERDISSFKISLSDEYFDKVLDSSFWPKHTVVHLFTRKARAEPVLLQPKNGMTNTVITTQR
ncbi:uncharacterized protein [Eurosta solidaginis]|uniref:uncharacterized protein n=1 Tax=Eurosta solidaginis TaxID=178769 RepID=UPI00353142E7